MTDKLTIYDQAFLDRIKQIKADMHNFYMSISQEPTPQYNGSGGQVIKKRPDGLDYLEEAYMRTRLDFYFPGWSWEGTFTQFVGGIEIVAIGGHLCIIDEHLLAFSIVPPVRKFYSVGAARIQFKKDAPHTVENIIDVDKNIAAANSHAFKRGVNRLCRIGDDVYGKRVDEEGGGTLEEIIMSGDASLARKMFTEYVSGHKVRVSLVCQTLNVQSLLDITDYSEAYQKLKQAGL